MDEKYRQTITRNKKARRNYHVDEEYEAGISLLGTEVKSIREGRVQLKDAYASFKDGELYMVNAHIAPYQKASHDNHRPERARKLLLHGHQIDRLRAKVQQEGYTLIPLELYFKGSTVKVNLGVCKGKKQHDKREDIKRREHEREVAREEARRQDYGDY